MARYSIDRALLAAERPEPDHPADRVIDVPNPWARIQAHMLCGLGAAMRCQCVILPSREPGSRVHMFGFASDIERTEVLYTSLLVQMWQGLAAAEVPAWSRSPRAWRRSWLLGFATAVVSRVRAAEQQADRRARAGDLKDFTGVSAPYEPPAAPELEIRSGEKPVEACLADLLAFVEDRLALK